MNLVCVEKPAAAPVTLDEARIHLRAEGDDADDAYIMACVSAATAQLDGAAGELNRCLVAQTWEASLDGFPGGDLYLPLTPVLEILSVKYRDGSDNEQTLDPSSYRLIGAGFSPRLELKSGASWPSTRDGGESVAVRFRAGYAPIGDTSPVDHAGNVPMPLKQAVLLLVGHFYANREAVVIGSNPVELPLGVQRLIAPYRFFR